MQVSFRVVTAIVLGYILANSISILIGFLLPLEKPNAVLSVSMLGFAIYTGLIMWIFYISNLRKMFFILLLMIAITGIASWGFYLLEATR